MNKERIKAAFRQVQEECKSRNGACFPSDRAPCKHNELCETLSLNNHPEPPKNWTLK
jgi:hypothetical protein